MVSCLTLILSYILISSSRVVFLASVISARDYATRRVFVWCAARHCWIRMFLFFSSRFSSNVPSTVSTSFSLSVTFNHVHSTQFSLLSILSLCIPSFSISSCKLLLNTYFIFCLKMAVSCRGRECKLGWGYNENFKIFISVQGKPPNVTSEDWNLWEYYLPKNLSSIDILYRVSLLFVS